MGIKKAPSTGAVKNGSVANVEDIHSFLWNIFYVKLVSGHSVHLLELPDVKLPVSQNDPLENKVVTGQKDPLAKS